MAQTSAPPMGGKGTFRWLWRQLTSMRTALVLLFLLAVASVPGSLLPQRGINPIKVREWIEAHPGIGPILDRAGFFDVFASPWFAAVYLLLFISLIGCVLPRTWKLFTSLRTPPPPAPRRLERMPAHVEFEWSPVRADPIDSAREYLRSRHWRVRTGHTPATGEFPASSWIAAEKGYLREVGNLVFHLSLIVVLASVALGGLFGWKGNVIVREGTGFSDTLTQYDAWGGGRMVDPASLPPFSFQLDDFQVGFERGEAQHGAPRLFEAHVTYWPTPAASPEQRIIEVNEPLSSQGVNVYLVGHGYAPHLIIRDAQGTVVFDDTVPFLPQDGNMSSTGVVKVPDMSPQLGIKGLFLPTTTLDSQGRPFSSFPAADRPSVVLEAFTGDLGLDDGVPQSVYSLATDSLTKRGVSGLFPGDTWEIPGVGSVEFAGFDQWASFQIAYDPGKGLALLSAAVAILGLSMSLLIRRRRLWAKAVTLPGGGTLIEVAGLAKGSAADLPRDVAALAQHLGAPMPATGSESEGTAP